MKTIVLFSGGLDSTVLLYHLKSLGHELKALGIDYGQRHSKELQSAAKIAGLTGTEFQVVDLSGLKPLFALSSLTNESVAVPDGHYEQESMKATVVPNRNMIMLSIAAAWAMSQKFDGIAFAAHGGDHAIYPDCRERFCEQLDATLKLADWHGVQLLRPFIEWKKSDICRRGEDLRVPFEFTWSCYKGGETHCGVCGTCNERREAFKLAEVCDPTVYNN
jgi:7-cyano-7-deazaguanine synthase